MADIFKCNYSPSCTHRVMLTEGNNTWCEHCILKDMGHHYDVEKCSEVK